MENFIREYDDVLTQHQIDKIAKELTSNKIPWFLDLPGTVTIDAYEIQADKNTKEAPQLAHRFNNEDGSPYSQFSNITDYILEKFIDHTGFKFKKLGRAKANLQLQNLDFKEDEYNTPHLDIFVPHWVLIYYVNDSDGNTKIFNKLDNGQYEIIKSIEPKAGKFVLFDGAYFHSGSHPAKSTYRIVINFNLLVK